MSRVARFTVVVGTTMERVPSDTGNKKIDMAFEIPSDFRPLGPSRFRTDVVLQFQAHAFNDPESIQVQFSINGRDVYEYGPTSENLSRCFIVTFGDSYLNPGANTMTIERTHGTGKLGVSNVVIWHETDVAMTNVRGKSTTSKTAPKRTAWKQTNRPAKKGGSGRSAR